MKKEKPSSKQMINAELATRAFNVKAKDMLKAHTPKESRENLVIEFHCECSNPACQERIPLTLQQYEALHTEKARFVLAKGHEEPKVEKIHHSGEEFSVVEKYTLQ